jgi:DNA polymerase-1
MTNILIDVSALAYRSFFTTGTLSYLGQNTGVLFGIFRYAQQLHAEYPHGRLIWCFDTPSTLRKEIFPAYKIKRATDLEDVEVVQARNDLHEQLNLLRDSYLPAMGYRNIFWRDGYEADDVIASVCKASKNKVVIVSSDSDLFQLLEQGRVLVHPPKGLPITEESFIEKYGISPKQWVEVKAIAGCSSDGVIGVKGVGEKTAIKYLRRELKRTSKLYIKIEENWHELIDMNRILVCLPFLGIGKFDLQKDELTDIKRTRVYRALGIKSLGIKV